MTTQRIDATTGSSDVAEQELKNRSRSYDLGTTSMLCPPNGVDDRCRFLHVAVFTDRGEELGSFQKLVSRNSGDAFHHFRRVTRIVLLQKLENRARMLQ